MERGTFTQVMRKAVKNRCRFISFGGGEPTLHKELEHFVRLSKSNSIYTSITTNGIKLVDIEFDRVHISHDIYHNTNKKKLDRALRHYSDLNAKVGINHIFTSFKLFEALYKRYWRKVDSILIVREKPTTIASVEDYHKLNTFLQSCNDGCRIRLQLDSRERFNSIYIY